MFFHISRKKFRAEVAKRTVAALDHAMTQMATDIHDHIIQKLAILELDVYRLKQCANDPVEVKNLMTQMRGNYDRLMEALDMATGKAALRPMAGDTLVAMLEALCQEMALPGIGHIHFSHEGTEAPLDRQVYMHIVPIVKALIRNAFRHSAASHIWVRLQWQPGMLTIEVEDDGSNATKQQGIIARLEKKDNTLKMRIREIGAAISYHQGAKGLLAIVRVRVEGLAG